MTRAAWTASEWRALRHRPDFFRKQDINHVPSARTEGRPVRGAAMVTAWSACSAASGEGRWNDRRNDALGIVLPNGA